MAKEKQICPMCGTKLKLTDGRMTCGKCGYYIRNQTENYSSQNTAPYQTQRGSRPNAGGQTGPVPSASPKNRGQNTAAAVVTTVILSSVSLLALGGIILFRTGALDALLRNLPPVSENDGRAESRIPADDHNTPEESSPAGIPLTADSLPRSDFFRRAAEAIWEKDYDAITPEEYADLTALQFDLDENVLYYRLGEGETQTLTYTSDIDMDYSDLSCFTGLQWLSLDDDLDEGDLQGLDNLYGVYSENTLSELAAIIPCPENITDLGTADSIFERNLNGIEAFPNLLYFSAEYQALEDISALLQYPDLLGLSLTDCDNLTDYSPLMSLTAMESLHIESDQLKSIDFIKQMPGLADLSITDTQITDIQALESCPELQSLYLTGNTQVSDYSVIGQLSRLREMELEVNYGGDLPSFAELTELTQLSVKYAGDLTPLKDAVHLTYLALEDCSGWELEALASLQELTVLVINDFSSYVESLEPLTRLPHLTDLSLEETSVFGNIEEIFGIPTLRSLYLDDCQVGLDFDSLPANENLELLSLSEISILRDPTYNNGDKVSLSEHYDMFERFPNLTELYLASLKLDSIAFVEKLPRLQYLDITDNNVTSLKPLEALSDFRAVWCGRNTILEKLPEDSDILVITED